MSNFRAAVSRLCSLSIPWTAEQCATLAEGEVHGARVYLANLAKIEVVTQIEDGRWVAGNRDAVRKWRNEWKMSKNKTKHGGTGAAYRRSKKLWEEMADENRRAENGGESYIANPIKPHQTPSRLPIQRRDGMITVAEAAEVFGVSELTIVRWSKVGKLRTERTIGGHRRIPTSEVERILSHGIEILRNRMQES